MKNVVFIMCDQLRYDIINGDLDYVKTPNIDRIKKVSNIFNNAYSQTPVCIPARYSLMSGKSPFKLGLLDNKSITPIISNPIAQEIKKSKMACFAVGKMHATPCRTHFGFDRLILTEEIVGHIQDDDHLLYLNEHGYGDIENPNGLRSEKYYVPQISQLPEKMHNSYFVAKKSYEIIKYNRNRPFFLYTSFIKPHPPFDPCEPYDEMYDINSITKPIRNQDDLKPFDRIIDIQNDYKINGIENISEFQEMKIRKAYFGSITQLDTGIGLILDTLEKYNLFDDTLLIFSSDHGEMLGDHYSYGKRCFYEQSARIPLLIKMPNQKHCCKNNYLATHSDIYATILDYCNVKIPETCDGFSLLSCFNNHKPIREEMFAEFGFNENFKFMYRKDNYKLIYFAEEGKVQLFDLYNDKYELHNIAKDNVDFVNNILGKTRNYYVKNLCNDGIENDRLKVYPKTNIIKKGYLNQKAKWKWSVINE